jgi:hypothetical protein
MSKHKITTEEFRNYLQAEYDACDDAEEKLHAIPPKFLSYHDLRQILSATGYDMGDDGMVSGEDILLIDKNQ